MATPNKPSSLLITVIIIVVLALAAATWLWLIPALDGTNTKQPTANTTIDTPKQPDNHATKTYEYTSAKGEIIKITGLAKGDTITSPLVIKGEVPGNWSHEGTFTIDLVYGGEDWLSLGSATATLSGDWMTSDYVPFTATLTFSLPPASEDITSPTLIIRNANPSGMPANDDSADIAVKL